MTSPDAPEHRGKPDIAKKDIYKEAGYEAGYLAKAVPEEIIKGLQELSRVEKIDIDNLKEEVSEERLRQLLGNRRFMGGYITGIGDFLIEKNGSFTSEDRGYPSWIEILQSQNGLIGFNNGLRREKLVEGENLKHLQGDEYILGFAISVARDFRIVPEVDEIPRDSIAFEAYEAGINGYGREFNYFEPLTIQSVPGSEPTKKHFDQEKIERQKKAYILGLKVWLKTQGFEGIEVTDIDSPNRLQAFRAGMDGKSVLDPEVQRLLMGEGSGRALGIPRPPELDRVKHKPGRSKHFSDQIDDEYYSPEIIRGELLSEEAQPSKSGLYFRDLIQRQTLRAYGLGQLAREQKEAARVKVRVFPPQSPS